MAGRTPTGRTLRYVRPFLYPAQEQAIFAAERYAVTEATPKSGKTVGCIVWLIEQAVLGSPGANYWWVAPVTAQADMAFDRAKRMLDGQAVKVSRTRKMLTLPNHTRIWFKSADAPDSLFGEDVHAAVIDEAPQVLTTLEQVLIGGEALSVPHVRRALRLLPGTTIVNGYGPTENTTFTCCYPIPRDLDASVPSVPIGRPIGATQVSILDRNMSAVPVRMPVA